MALKVLINVTERCVAHKKGPCSFFTFGPFSVLWGRWYSQQLLPHDGKSDNVALLQNLKVIGVDVAKVRKLYPSVLRSSDTHEDRLREFLLEKGADHQTVASIISRYPRAITRRSKDLAEVWGVWESMLKTDSAVLRIVSRSPESFFRSGSTEKLVENISFLQSLGLPPKVLSQLMAKAPRTFSNSPQLNKQKVDFFRELCVRLGGEDPDECVRQIITSNIYILTRSTKRVKGNLESIQSLMKLEDKEMLSWFKGEGACILGLCNTYVKDNFLYVQQKFQSEGCSDADISRYIYKNPSVLLLSPKIFSLKLDLLLDCGVEASEILDTPYVLEVSLGSMRNKVKVLKKLGYDFKNNGLTVLLLSQARFSNKMEKLSSPTDKAAKQC
ncbi:transcription termination factor 1, mitochondrial-like [Gastrophryne carolinensis]